MWTRLLTRLRKTASEEPPRQKIERLMNCLRSTTPGLHRNTDFLLSRMLMNDVGYEPEFLVALLEALAQEADADQLDFVPRSILILAGPNFGFGRPGPVQAAAQACLTSWQAKQEERAQGSVLLRASQSPTSGKDILLRPASGNPAVEPEQLLRAVVPEEKE